MQIYKDGTYLKNAPTWHAQDSPWKAKQIIKMIERNSIKLKSIGEIGCGAGEILYQLSEYYSNDKLFCGYDISPQAIQICKNKVKSNLTFKLMDCFYDEHIEFDLILVIDVVEHIDDYIGFLKFIKNEGIYKIFHFPLDLSAQTIIRSTPILKCRKESGHLHYFTKDTALETLKYCGYNILDNFYTGASIDPPYRGLKANILKIPRKILFKINKDLTSRLLGGYSLMVLAY